MEATHHSLLVAARAGDQAAWDELVARFNNLVWSVVRGYRLSAADSDDAVQMTWLKLVENLDRIRDAERLPAWLATTARRECLQQLRRRQRDAIPVDDTGLDHAVDDADPVDAAVLLDERDGALWRAFTALGERCRRLLRVLMASPPPSYDEVAAALDMPRGSIGPTRQRCLASLRAIVEGDGDLVAALREEE
ncbi:RNA polymerase sigma factor (sigma-70 family) [Nocardioides sp. BE266]|uniref:RNA polymerase sigma factor n=1 Tax=Nocardioides sp. BE266 TaxID=2817725 RepID=UPI002864D1F1|nr:sigma-70 family RNA polymerase sigma factor [Nocardioides sp. BE266]MDR7252599.1 RNA polymerase sigma factor (sigma-70 family) [Nocardioides sp. BE266]